jgi:outer membrane protein assembly factor BamB
MTFAAALAIVAVAAPVVGATPEARQMYGLVWHTPVVVAGPCATSIVLPPSEQEHCTSWTRRETAGPAFHERLGVVVMGGADRIVRGLDGRDGHVLWHRATTGAIVARPTIVDDAAFVATDDGRVMKLDVSSGRVRWETPVDAEVTEPVVVHDGALYVVTGSDSTFALSASSGEALWVHKHALPRGITLRGHALPLVADVMVADTLSRRLYVGHADGRVSVLDRETGAKLDEIDVSRGDTFGDVDADPLLHRVEGMTRVVVASHTRGVVALDPRTHAEMWRLNEPGIVRLANGGAPMIVAAGAGKVLGLDARTGKARWRFTFKKGAPTRLVVQGGRVHVASDRGALYVLDLFSGRPLQYAGSGLGIAADLDIAGDMLFYTSTSGALTALSSAWRGGVFAVTTRADRTRR